MALLVPAAAAPAARPAPQPAPFRASVAPLSDRLRARIEDDGYWHRGCPVALSGLRVLTVTHHGFDGRRHTGRILVNATATQPLARVFRRLYALHFPIRRIGTEPRNG